jgi:hypothetical protein
MCHTAATPCAFDFKDSTPHLRQEPAALREFDRAYDRSGSFTSFPPSRRVRFALKKQTFGQCALAHLGRMPMSPLQMQRFQSPRDGTDASDTVDGSSFVIAGGKSRNSSLVC